MAKDENKLDELKKEYAKIKKKHNLPEFSEMNEDFHIEKIAESETDILIREVRKFVGDKMMNYMRFVESLLNPVNAPMFVFSFIKLLDADEKKKISEIYKELMKREVRFIELELEFNEKKEVQFVNESYKFWQKTKKELLDILKKIDEKWDDKLETNNKGYFG